MVRLIAANDVDVGAFAGGRAQYAPRVDPWLTTFGAFEQDSASDLHPHLTSSSIPWAKHPMGNQHTRKSMQHSTNLPSSSYHRAMTLQDDAVGLFVLMVMPWL